MVDHGFLTLLVTSSKDFRMDNGHKDLVVLKTLLLELMDLSGSLVALLSKVVGLSIGT